MVPLSDSQSSPIARPRAPYIRVESDNSLSTLRYPGASSVPASPTRASQPGNVTVTSSPTASPHGAEWRPISWGYGSEEMSTDHLSASREDRPNLGWGMQIQPSVSEFSLVNQSPIFNQSNPTNSMMLMPEQGLAERSEFSLDSRMARSSLRSKPNEASSKHTTGSVVVRVSETLKRHFDPKFMLSVIDIREIIFPVTPRRVGFMGFYAGLIVGLVFLNAHVHFTHYIGQGIRYNNHILMGVIYGLEPVMMMVLLCIASLPPRAVRPTHGQDGEHPSRTETTALVIPCHNSEPTSLLGVLDAALVHFRPEQIFIVDNGNEASPPTDTNGVVTGKHPDINYIWSSIGSKNAAQFIGAMAAHRYDHIMTIDDDVSLPNNFMAPVDRITEKTKAVCFPVQGMNKNGERPLFVGWQDAEYKFSGLSKEGEAATCGVMYPHGAGCFWDRKTLCEVLRLHDLIFIAEDVKMGLGLQRLGKSMTIDSSVVLDTEVPETVMGAFPNYWQQRVRSWEMGRHLLYLQFAKRLVRLNGQRTVKGFAMQKVSQSYAIASNLVDWLRIPLFVAMGSDPSFWYRSAGFYATPIVPMLLYKYLKCRNRPDIEPSFAAAITFPVYKLLYGAVSILGAIRSVAYWWPAFKAKPTIAKLERSNDPRAIWLDPRFAENPNFLLGEQQAQETLEILDPSDREDGITDASQLEHISKWFNTPIVPSTLPANSFPDTERTGQMAIGRLGSHPQVAEEPTTLSAANPYRRPCERVMHRLWLDRTRKQKLLIVGGAATILGLAVGVGAGVGVSQAKSSPSGAIPPFNSTFVSLDPSEWTVSDNTSNRGAYRCGFTRDAVTVANNAATLSVFPGHYSNQSYGCAQLLHRNDYLFGHFSARMRAARDPGVVTALFTYVETAPDINQEIDIEFTGANTSEVWMTAYRDGQVHSVTAPLGFDAAAGFHDYAFEWRSSYIAWSVDGQELHRLNESLPQPVSTKFMMSTWLRAPGGFAGDYDPTVVQARTTSAYSWVAFQP